MGVVAYALRCIIMLLVTWTAVRIIGKKSISNMTSYDLAAIMLITTVAAEPLVYKIPSKATVGVFVLMIVTILLGYLSLKKFFYNIDSKPLIIVANGTIQEKELRYAKMNIPLLLSELRLKGYQNIGDVRYAIIEPSGKLSVVPTSQARPLQPSDMAIPPTPVSLSFPLIIDGKVNHENLTFLQKDLNWLLTHLRTHAVQNVEEVSFAQMDGSGKIQIIKQHEQVQTPNIY
ncbi:MULTISPECIES: YetF domain-containing protein [Pontibacillus]|uniref:DUF421 domain-containing protein n=1 Tax=Pontibacillus chungwhensis TaxID=265426 RepID=A0ABY8V063_9BACI|nr:MULTISPECIES: DUF421 domain-containing protein [Pontibacillus]MCD5324365.1 DUF421 domain-containing protein [Pontibacillus sp. HN14]WIF99336.1 DUF421 domain-containing protein [Pontibacillus chungwhensis]